MLAARFIFVAPEERTVDMGCYGAHADVGFDDGAFFAALVRTYEQALKSSAVLPRDERDAFFERLDMYVESAITFAAGSAIIYRYCLRHTSPRAADCRLNRSRVAVAGGFGKVVRQSQPGHAATVARDLVQSIRRRLLVADPRLNFKGQSLGHEEPVPGTFSY